MGATSAGSSDEAPEGAGQSLGSWGVPATDPTWTPIEASSEPAGAASSEPPRAAPSEPAGTSSGPDAPGPATSAARSKRPTAYGLPPVTERSSDLRSTISDALTTKAPSPLSRLSAAAAGAAAAVGSAASSAAHAGEHRASETAPAQPTPNAQPSESKPSGPSPIEQLKALTAERPEVAIGAAFLGGLLLATILKRLAR